MASMSGATIWMLYLVKVLQLLSELWCDVSVREPPPRPRLEWAE